MRLGILDQSPIPKGAAPEQALNQTLELAQYAESLGYERYWVAEHHNTNGLAGSSPEILMTRIASATSTIRVGSGGVLLPQYSPLKVAENFKVLEAFFPNRIDLGLGRSPGGSQQTRMALTDGASKTLSAFSRQVKELHGYLYDTLPDDHAYKGVLATPRTSSNPETWILGLSERGAKHAAINGTGFTFGHFISPDKADEAISTYLDRFKPSPGRSEPAINACVFVVCAETQEEAERLAQSQDMWLLQVEKNEDTTVPSVEEVEAHSFTEREIEKIKRNRRRTIVGTPAHVKEQLTLLSERYQTDEFLLITNIYDQEARKTSYRLLAEHLL
ncbi:hypothetical protein N781_04055 [Pontibacillus halophilus JSM 076056 = DSM 19796]|uniref:Luciferase-like domain-containing protein n=1 Tax=Pontibacillus halophilus JSM 076056 = DSM 19796 TaxID=1385510 RepID=A0A0A5I739_9BACI|nr:LLM class flavin-dependent oxidoreductase [Pontibacillus halophilus]KGX91652.1 hypothetical protein N781_04055 [Pontibacillus halophilus JSM 076056 = DSM 19796]